MKVICVLTCALVACGMAASAASIEQVLDFSVTGSYQGITTNVGVNQRARSVLVRITSDNIVRALAVDHRDNPSFTNFYRYGHLYYKVPLDGSTTNVVIRAPGNTNELDVTGAFTFTNGTFVVDELANTNSLYTNSYVETGLSSVSFTSSSVSFTNIGLSFGTSTRTKKITGYVDHMPTNGFANLLSYSGGGGTFTLNTNRFYTTNFTFAATNEPVTGPAQINFRTFAPVISPN